VTRIIFSLVIFSGSFSAYGYEVIAHRGVHQTYLREGLENDTCTADRIYPPTHTYVENTVASITRAFELGATIVELDIHPTSEVDSSKNQIVVFHDWTLNCRTDAKCDAGCKCNEKKECVTHEQPLSYLKTLDIGYNYTADSGKTFPFRGEFRGEIQTLKDILNLMEKNKTWKILINVKDGFESTQELLLREINEYPLNVRERILAEYSENYSEQFKKLGVQAPIWQGGGPAKKCYRDYIALGMTGYFPESCRNIKLFVPLHETMERATSVLKSVKLVSLLWGWPHKFIERAHDNGTEIYISQVDTLADWNEVRNLKADGIMTNKIEVIGPKALNPK